jgi:hypothetical protein
MQGPMPTLLNSSDDSRGQKALALVSSGALEQPVWLDQSLSQRLVPSCTKEGAFYVTDAKTCTCPDAKYRRAVCKHQQAVRLANVLKLAQQENQQAQLEVVA